MEFLGSWLRWIWRANRPLTGVGVGFVLVLGVSLVGLAIDDRLIGGSPAWLKPVKFALSSALYCLTLAVFYAAVGRTSRAMGVAGWLIAATLVLEVGIIDTQAARGLTSHFNRATPLDAALFGVMGVAILILLIASVVIAVELCRVQIADRVLAWSIRLGMIVTVLGSLTGGLMVVPTSEQLVAASATGKMPISGSHIVGGRDGGAGLPLTSWSRTHGDLRVPHFFGLHAIQAIPMLCWFALRVLKLRSEQLKVMLICLIAVSYLAAILLLTTQALGGQSVVAVQSGWLFGWLITTFGGVLALQVCDRMPIRMKRSLVCKGA